MIPNVEYAAGSGGPGNIATKLRNAPLWVRTQIARQKTAAPPAAPKHVAAKRTTPRQPVATLLLALAPGVSQPVTLAGGSESLPETISTRAWKGVLEQLASGRQVAVQLGHGLARPIVATTGTPAVRCRLCATGGLMLQVDLFDADVVGPMKGASIAFRPRDYRRATIDGRACRVVDSLELSHIALIAADDRDEPTYTLARVVRCRPKESAAKFFDLVGDTARAVHKANPGLRAALR
jgi:hypothetical protein